MTQVDDFITFDAEHKFEFKLSFKLHSIIMLIGPDGSGKTEFSMEQLMLQLKMAQTGNKKIKIAYVSMKDIFSELLDCHQFSFISSEAKVFTEEVYKILLSKVKSLTSYPVNFDFVIVDSMGIDSLLRAELLKIGEENHYHVSAVIFNYKDKSKYLSANPVHMKEFKRVISGEITKKEFATFDYIESRDFDKYEIVVDDYSLYDQYILPDKEYVIIGDIHGCFEEFVALLQLNGFLVNEDFKVTHPEGKCVLLVGDLIDKGYAIKEVIELVYANLDTFYMVIGNHENLVYKKVSGALKKGSLPSSEVVEEFFNSIDLFQNDEILKEKFFKVFESMKSFYVHKNFIVTHSPCEKKFLGKISPKALKAARDFRYPKKGDFEDFASFMIEFDERTLFLRNESSDFHPIHVFGHVMSKEMSGYKNKLDIDTGCVSGGELTSITIDKYLKISKKSVLAGDNIVDNKKQLYNFFY